MAKAKFDHPIPEALRDRPVDPRGYPIPHSAHRDPDTCEYDFRILDMDIRMADLKARRCAVSGKPLKEGEYWLIGGPPSFEHGIFVDGPMLHEVAEFSLMTCPHLALPAAQYRRTGLEDTFRPAGTSLEKSPILMLGMTPDYELVESNDFTYVRAKTWRAVSWWLNGRRLGKQEAIKLLREVAPDLDITRGGRLRQ